ncbi:hypothetical protein RCL_jg23919.t2 [Rhizophagus clarus]|uniref:Uncharacterized protein n=1 Tax=Rhizophagus clarus TaxID=94130 RepID=A0A8H3LQ52_9GLOM|nr:hypothetical protein RCL_jg23919.t2 [Rhizophagus clarus]
MKLQVTFLTDPYLIWTKLLIPVSMSSQRISSPSSKHFVSSSVTSPEPPNSEKNPPNKMTNHTRRIRTPACDLNYISLRYTSELNF